MLKKSFQATVLLTISFVLLSGCQGSPPKTAAVQNQQALGGANQPPADAPSDVPSLPEGKNFAWVGAGGDEGTLGFYLDSNDFKASCDRLGQTIKTAGWQDFPQSTLNYKNAAGETVMYQKTGYALELSCVLRQSGGVFVTERKIADSQK